MDEAWHAAGLGRQLLTGALHHCDQAGFARVWLTTFAGLDRARQLYERAGVVLEHGEDDSSRGRVVSEQRGRP